MEEHLIGRELGLKKQNSVEKKTNSSLGFSSHVWRNNVGVAGHFGSMSKDIMALIKGMECTLFIGRAFVIL